MKNGFLKGFNGFVSYWRELNIELEEDFEEILLFIVVMIYLVYFFYIIFGYMCDFMCKYGLEKFKFVKEIGN